MTAAIETDAAVRSPRAGSDPLKIRNIQECLCHIRFDFRTASQDDGRVRPC
jgi:hypothetical protein